MKTLAALAWVLAIGCSASDQPFAPASVTTGIYTATATRSNDDCTPPRYEGSREVGVFDTADGLQLYALGPDSESAFVLAAAEGYALRDPAEGQRLDPCADGSASSVVFHYTLTSASTDHVEVEEDETWSLAHACGVGSVGGSTIPSASCSATRTLTYDLVQACAPPCTIVSDAGSSEPTCRCGP